MKFTPFKRYKDTRTNLIRALESGLRPALANYGNAPNPDQIAIRLVDELDWDTVVAILQGDEPKL